MTPALTPAALSLAAALVALAFPAHGVNGYSFLDAASSPLDYRVANASPRMACRALKAQGRGALTILSAEEVPASADAPAFCRVHGVIAAEVQFEVALPLAWNKRLYMRGNGGFAGESLTAPIRVTQRNMALKNGFVAVQTNTGHDANGEPLGSFAHNNLQKTVDYGFRAVHESARAAKRLTRAYYDRPAAHSYWDGCSTGGRQALISAQRYPGDFDGIIAGSPVLNFTDSLTTALWNAQQLARAPVPIAKLKLVGDAVYERCDAKDGAKDGIIDDPRACDFDPSRDVKACAARQDGLDCLTAAQAGALKSIYAGPRSNGRAYFFGQTVGAEKIGQQPTLPGPSSGWDFWIIPPSGKSRQLQYGDSFVKYMAFHPKADPAYDWQKFDFDKDYPRISPAIRGLLDAVDPDLSEFRARGGKLLMYFGWADTALAPGMAVDYYEKVQAKMGAGVPGFMRLFMVPGMFHCRGGVGVDRLDAMTPLVNWVENGKAPERIVAGRMEQGRIVRTRPLCAYPQVAKWDGRGSLDEEKSFACSAP